MPISERQVCQHMVGPMWKHTAGGEFWSAVPSLVLFASIQTMSETSQQSRHRRFKFGLGSLLLSIACFAGMFGGFHIGRIFGQKAGEQQREAELCVPRIYFVGDLVATREPSRSDLISDLEEIEHESWSVLGGYGCMAMVDSRRLLVSQTVSVHDKIAVALAEMRQLQSGGEAPPDNSSSNSNP